jgi:hypothetical protein
MTFSRISADHKLFVQGNFFDNCFPFGGTGRIIMANRPVNTASDEILTGAAGRMGAFFTTMINKLIHQVTSCVYS